MDGRRSPAPRPAHRSGLVLHVPGRRAARANGDHLTISVPSNHVRDRILTRYLPLVTEALDEIVAPGCSLDIVVAGRARSTRRRRSTTGAARPRRRSTPALGAGPDGAALLDEAGLNPRYTFETFVKGASNQFALAAALRVAETPARSYNPLFIYGVGRPRQDPPAARHRPLRAPQLPAPRGALRLDRDVPQRVRRRHPHQHRQRLQAPLPRHRRPAHRRHPVPGEPRGPAGGVLPHVQLAARRQQADRHLLRPRARRHPDARGAPARPVQVGPDHRHPAARPGDPPGHPAQQGRARPGRGARRDARVHRHQDLDEHPRARGGADPRHRLRQPQPRADHHRAGPAPARRPAARDGRPGRAPTRSCSPRSPASSASTSPR